MHGHAHTTAERHQRAFRIGIALNIAFVLVELGAGFIAHSVSLLADAGHNAADVLGLGLAWGAALLSKMPPSPRRTYGFRRTTIVAALANAVLILVGIGVVVREAIGRLTSPAPASGVAMMAVAAIGVVINAGTALAFARDRACDANVRGAFVHLASDAAVSAGVVVAGALVWVTGATWIDPVTSLAVSAGVVIGAWTLLRVAVDLSLDAVPAGIDTDAVRTYLVTLASVREVHDLHIWPLSTTETGLTAHLVVTDDVHAPALLSEISRDLRARFHIAHTTVQLEHLMSPLHCEGC